jgi:hypothetical protein
MPTYSQTLPRSIKIKSGKKIESTARSVPEISVQVVEERERLRRKRPAEEMSFKPA